MTLRDDFGEDFASTAFGEVAGDKAIIGKWGYITQLDDGTYDCWFIGRDRFLTGRRLAKIERECLPEDRFVKLTGEGWAQGRGRDFVLRMAVLAGVRKKRRMSPEAKERQRNGSGLPGQRKMPHKRRESRTDQDESVPEAGLGSRRSEEAS